MRHSISISIFLKELGTRDSTIVAGDALSWPAAPEKECFSGSSCSAFLVEKLPALLLLYAQIQMLRYTDTDIQKHVAVVVVVPADGHLLAALVPSSGSVPLCATNENADRQRAPADDSGNSNSNIGSNDSVVWRWRRISGDNETNWTRHRSQPSSLTTVSPSLFIFSYSCQDTSRKIYLNHKMRILNRAWLYIFQEEQGSILIKYCRIV